MKRIDANEVTPVKTPTREIDDRATVRMGSMSPSFPATKLAAASVADSRKIQMGSMSPAFPRARPA
jgi:hypothetical protein